MSLLLPVSASIAGVLSALALYAGSAHCRWPALHRWRGMATWVGGFLALASLALWIADLGVGAGMCAMLGTWMLALMAFPYLAAWTSPANDTQVER